MANARAHARASPAGAAGHPAVTTTTAVDNQGPFGGSNMQRFRWSKCIPVLAAAAIPMAGTALADDFNVVAGNFTAGSSWLDGSPPGGADDAQINNAGTATINVGDAITIRSLRL